MLAGRNVGMGFGVATVMATWITSNTTMLAPQFALELGILGMLAYSTASCGLLLFAPLAKRIRRLMPHGYTSGDFMRLRYGKGPWLIFLGISLFYALTWLVSMGMAGGILLNALAGIPYVWGMSALLTVCVLYTVFGGLYAVIGTDFIQSLIILIGIVVIGVGILQVSDFENMYTHVAAESPMLLNMLFPAALLALFNNLFFGVNFSQQRLVEPGFCVKRTGWTKHVFISRTVMDPGAHCQRISGLIQWCVGYQYSETRHGRTVSLGTYTWTCWSGGRLHRALLFTGFQPGQPPGGHVGSHHQRHCQSLVGSQGQRTATPQISNMGHCQPGLDHLGRVPSSNRHACNRVIFCRTSGGQHHLAHRNRIILAPREFARSHVEHDFRV